MSRILFCVILRLHKLGGWGYGFGHFDIYCRRCEKRIKTYEVGRLVGQVAVHEDTPGAGA